MVLNIDIFMLFYMSKYSIILRMTSLEIEDLCTLLKIQMINQWHPLKILYYMLLYRIEYYIMLYTIIKANCLRVIIYIILGQ